MVLAARSAIGETGGSRCSFRGKDDASAAAAAKAAAEAALLQPKEEALAAAPTPEITGAVSA